MKFDLLDLITFPFDDETKRHLLAYYQAKGTLLDSDLIEEHLVNQPALGCLVLFLLFLTLVSLVFAIIFVSCRALGNCGAKRYQPHPTSGRRYTFHLVVFLLSWVVLCSSSVYFIYSGVSFWGIRVPPAFNPTDIKYHELNRRSVDYPDYSNHGERKITKRGAQKPTQSVFDLFSNADYEGDFERLDPTTTTAATPEAAFVTAPRASEPIPIGIVRNEDKKFFAPLDYTPIPPRPTLPVVVEETTPTPAVQKLAIRKIQREQVKSEVIPEAKDTVTSLPSSFKHYEIPARPEAEIEYSKKMKNDKRMLSAPFIADVPTSQAFMQRKTGTGNVQSTVSQNIPVMNEVDADLSPIHVEQKSAEEPMEITEEQLMLFAEQNHGADLPSDVKFIAAEDMTTTTEETTVTVTQPTTSEKEEDITTTEPAILKKTVNTDNNQEVVAFENTAKLRTEELLPLKIVQTNDEPIQTRVHESAEGTEEPVTTHARDLTTATTETPVNVVHTLENNDSPNENSILEQHSSKQESEEDSFDPFVAETTLTPVTRPPLQTVQGIRITDRPQPTEAPVVPSVTRITAKAEGVSQEVREIVPGPSASQEVREIVPGPSFSTPGTTESEEYEDSREVTPVVVEPTTTTTTERPQTVKTTTELPTTTTTEEEVRVSEEIEESTTTEEPTTTTSRVLWPENLPAANPELFSPAWNRRKWTTEKTTQETITVNQPVDHQEHMALPKSQENENDYADETLELSKEKMQVITARPPTAPPTTDATTTEEITTTTAEITTTTKPAPSTVAVESQEDESNEFVVIQKKPNDLWEQQQSTKSPVSHRNFSIIPTVSLAGDGAGEAEEMYWSRLYAFRLLHTSSIIWMSRLALILIGSLMTVVVLPSVVLVGIGSLCYMKSYHPMDRTKSSDKVGQVVVLLSTILLFCIPLILVFVIGCIIYTHLHNAVCPLLQLQYQQSLGLLGNVTSFTETTGEIMQRMELNSHNCINSQVPLEGMWIACLLFLVSAVPILVSLFKLSKYYLRMKTEYYWTMDDHYGTIYAKRAYHTDGIYGNIYGTLRAPVRPTVRPPPIPAMQPPPNVVFASEPIYAEGPGPLYHDGPIYGAYAAYGRL